MSTRACLLDLVWLVLLMMEGRRGTAGSAGSVAGTAPTGDLPAAAILGFAALVLRIRASRRHPIDGLDPVARLDNVGLE
jgi:hypothetical protein